MPAAATNLGSGTLRTVHLTLIGAGVGLFVLVGFLRIQSGEDDTITTLEWCAGAAALVGAGICGLILLYRACRCVENGTVRYELREKWLDPGTAVALCAIPIVNLIGSFVVLGPLPRHLNRVARAVGTRQDAPRDLGYAFSVMAVLSAVPVVGLLFALVAAVMFPILIFRCSKVADAIQQAMQPAPAVAAPPVSLPV